MNPVREGEGALVQKQTFKLIPEKYVEITWEKREKNVCKSPDTGDHS